MHAFFDVLAFIALVVFVVAIVGLCVGHLHWARIATRTPMAITVGGAFVVFVVAAASAAPAKHDNPGGTHVRNAHVATASTAVPAPTSASATATATAATSVAMVSSSPPPPSSAPAPVETTATKAPVVAAPPPLAAETTETTPRTTPAAAPSPASCHPLTNSGKCYEPGEYCRSSDHGVTGVAGDGKTITCEDNDGWRWEPS